MQAIPVSTCLSKQSRWKSPTPLCLTSLCYTLTESTCFLHLLHLQERRGHKWKLWIHLLLPERTNLFHDLSQDEEKFFYYFRKSLASFDKLLHSLHGHLVQKNTKMRNSILTVLHQPQDPFLFKRNKSCTTSAIEILWRNVWVWACPTTCEDGEKVKVLKSPVISLTQTYT